MKAYIEIQIRFNLTKGETLNDVLREFSRDSHVWSFPKVESETYQKHIGEDGGYLVRASGKGIKQALIAIATAKAKRPHTFYVANIVPRDCFELTIDEYNAIGLALARDLRRWFRKNSFDGKIQCTNPDKTLADIIPGPKCRKLFEHFLSCDVWNSQALPSHPSDIEKLDFFICALFRYGTNVQSDEIERFLTVDKKWSQADAAWVRARIDTGLDVLKLDRRF